VYAQRHGAKAHPESYAKKDLKSECAGPAVALTHSR
jgi:hypothetical protein